MLLALLRIVVGLILSNSAAIEQPAAVVGMPLTQAYLRFGERERLLLVLSSPTAYRARDGTGTNSAILAVSDAHLVVNYVGKDDPPEMTALDCSSGTIGKVSFESPANGPFTVSCTADTSDVGLLTANIRFMPVRAGAGRVIVKCNAAAIELPVAVHEFPFKLGTAANDVVQILGQPRKRESLVIPRHERSTVHYNVVFFGNDRELNVEMWVYDKHPGCVLVFESGTLLAVSTTPEGFARQLAVMETQFILDRGNDGAFHIEPKKK